ncbi:hypothetical protein FRC17_009617 [Serendipita sp. 399]|nr:hypothetical protein FRC17_009617 [Serendipita sp. 399]
MEHRPNTIPVHLDATGFDIIQQEGGGILLVPKQNRVVAAPVNRPVTTTNGPQNQVILPAANYDNVAAMRQWLHEHDLDENKYRSLKEGLASIKDQIEKCDQLVEAHRQEISREAPHATLPAQFSPSMPQAQTTYTLVPSLQQAQYGPTFASNASGTSHPQRFQGAAGTSSQSNYYQRAGSNPQPTNAINSQLPQSERAHRSSMPQQAPQSRQRQLNDGLLSNPTQFAAAPGYQYYNMVNNVGMMQNSNSNVNSAQHPNVRTAPSNAPQYSIPNAGLSHNRLPQSNSFTPGYTQVSGNHPQSNAQTSYPARPITVTRQPNSPLTNNVPIAPVGPLAPTLPSNTQASHRRLGNPPAQEIPSASTSSITMPPTISPRSNNMGITSSSLPLSAQPATPPNGTRSSEPVSLAKNVLQYYYGKRKAQEAVESSQPLRKKVAREGSPRVGAQADTGFASDFWETDIPPAETLPQVTQLNGNSKSSNGTMTPAVLVEPRPPPTHSATTNLDNTWNRVASIVSTNKAASPVHPPPSPVGARIEEVGSDDLPRDIGLVQPLRMASSQGNAMEVISAALPPIITSSHGAPTDEPLFLPETSSPVPAKPPKASVGKLPRPRSRFLYVEVPRPTPNPIRYGPSHPSQERYSCTFRTLNGHSLRAHTTNVHNDDMALLKPFASSCFLEPPEPAAPLPDLVSSIDATVIFFVTGDPTSRLLSRTPSPIPASQSFAPVLLSPTRRKPAKNPDERKKDEWAFLDPFYEDPSMSMDELDENPLNAFMAEIRSPMRSGFAMEDDPFLD